MNRSARSARPAYLQVADALREDISVSRLGPGDQLPSEHQLMARFAVSRTTIRKALDQLTAANLIRRHQGLGSFVAPQGLSHGLGDLRSLTQVMRDRGLEPGIREVSVKLDHYPPLEAREYLRSTDLWCVARTRTGNGRPFCTQDSWIPADLAATIDANELEARQSLYALLKEVAGAVPDEATEIIRAEAATTSEAQRLEVEPGSPLIVIYRWTQDHRGRPIEYARSASPGDRYEYVIKLQG
jgi:DNA-binding GntR family transcriptional regulator